MLLLTAMADLADKLETHLAIYKYLYNNINTEYYNGSRKGALGTYEQNGGDIWYENIFEIDGWKIQCHSGLLQNHYRILDANDRRRAWTLDPKELKANLIIFKDNK